MPSGTEEDGTERDNRRVFLVVFLGGRERYEAAVDGIVLTGRGTAAPFRRRFYRTAPSRAVPLIQSIPLRKKRSLVLCCVLLGRFYFSLLLADELKLRLKLTTPAHTNEKVP